MMRRLLFIFPIITLFLCSWVDPTTVDTYSGYCRYVYSQYDVVYLTGELEYYLMDYVPLGLSDDGSLLNVSPNTLKGIALIDGDEYPIQFSSNGGLQIQQTYYTNNIERTTWVQYDLYPDVVPSSFSLSEVAPVCLVFFLFMLIPLIFYRGILI